jgi:hypothetical protein
LQQETASADWIMNKSVIPTIPTIIALIFLGINNLNHSIYLGFTICIKSFIYLMNFI